MAYRWPAETVFTRIDLDVEERSCPSCDRAMHVCDHRYHHLWTLAGPTQVVNRLVRCPDPTCDSRGQTFSPAAELSISMPRWCMGWEVLCWLGHRRFARHWSMPQLRAELQDTYHIRLSDDALTSYLGRYQTMLAARQQDPERLADDYRDIASLVLTIDGLQPEKGHETLYVVRELRRKRVWFAEPLLSSATQEVQRVIVLARQWAERLAKPVGVWMSDKQDAFVQAIGTEFPTTPHRYCHHHFLRDVAKPVLELDSQAKVKMRRKVRGLRTIERQVLEDRRRTVARAPSPSPGPLQADETPRVALSEAQAPEACAQNDLGAGQTPKNRDTTAWTVMAPPAGEDEAGEVVLGYCAAVRGILNDDQGGPLHPPGVRMREALQEVRESLDRNLDAKKGGVQRRC
jgi:MULE transposase domain.